MAHKRAKSGECGVAKVSIDYAFMGKDKEMKSTDDEHEEESGMPILVLKDKIRQAQQMWFLVKEITHML